MNTHPHTSVLNAIVESSEYLNPDSPGGAHADVLAIDGERLGNALCRLAGRKKRLEGPLREAAAAVADRFIMKRGKIEDFSMQLVGPRENVLPRDAISHAFGPYGYNLLPTTEKVMMDAHEAARQVPYLGFGERNRLLAPDIVRQFGRLLDGSHDKEALLEPEDGRFLVFLDDSRAADDIDLNLYQLLRSDTYFKGRVDDFGALRDYQRFVRANPVTRDMEDPLASFFQAPITVGVRDTLRWAMGSRHPELGWERARQVIEQAFERWGHENFAPPEISYYARILNGDEASAQRLLAENEVVVELFAEVLDAHLKAHGFLGFDPTVLRKLSRQILDFHHGYPLYELEPYQGLLSVSTLKMVVRVVFDLSLALSKLRLPERRNLNLGHLGLRPGPLVQILATMDEAARERFFAAIEDSLKLYLRRSGLLDSARRVRTYERVSRTFYSFQEKAMYSTGLRGRIEETFTLEQLHEPPRNELLTSLPELSEKLTVFFTLVYRYYRDTGFVPDLRPKNAGRDIFLLGIWGHVSDNLLITTWRDDAGELHADLSFVDNKDQFKEYRRVEDRRAPVGLAKHALRLTGSVVEPAMLRSIGLFAELAHSNQAGNDVPHSSVMAKYSSRGLDILHEVIHSGIENFFDNAKVTAEDVVDDLFTGVKKWFRL